MWKRSKKINRHLVRKLSTEILIIWEAFNWKLSSSIYKQVYKTKYGNGDSLLVITGLVWMLF